VPFNVHLYLLKVRHLRAVAAVQYIVVTVAGNEHELQLAPDIAGYWWRLSSEYRHMLLKYHKGGKSTLGSELDTDKRCRRSYG